MKKQDQQPMNSIDRTRRVVPLAEAEDKINARIAEGAEILRRNVATSEELEMLKRDIRAWTDYNGALLKRIFTTDEIASEYLKPLGLLYTMGADLVERLEHQRRNMDAYMERLRSIRERLDLYDDEERNHAPEEGVESGR